MMTEQIQADKGQPKSKVHLPGIVDWLKTAPTWVDCDFIDYDFIRRNFSLSKSLEFQGERRRRFANPDLIIGTVNQKFIDFGNTRNVLNDATGTKHAKTNIISSWLACSQDPSGLNRTALMGGADQNLWNLERTSRGIFVISGNHRSIMSRVLRSENKIRSIRVNSVRWRSIDWEAYDAYRLLINREVNFELNSHGLETADLRCNFEVKSLFRRKSYSASEIIAGFS